jgi:multiple sugar transport system permease protein
VVRALRNTAGFLYVLPALAFVGFFVIWPLIQLVNISFTDTSLLGGGKYV